MADRVVNRAWSARLRIGGNNRSLAPEHAWSQTRSHIAQRQAHCGRLRRERRLGPRRGVPLRRGPVRQAPERDLRVPRPHAPGPRARRRPHPGRVREGVSRLRLAPEARERACVAVPDRAPRRPRQPPPQADRPLRAARRRDPQHEPVGRAPRDGPAPVGRPPASPGEDPGAPARRPPPRRASRPDAASSSPPRSACPTSPPARSSPGRARASARHSPIERAAIAESEAAADAARRGETRS